MSKICPQGKIFAIVEGSAEVAGNPPIGEQLFQIYFDFSEKITKYF